MTEAQRQSKGTVLIVEDDASLAGIILELLTDEGYAVSVLGSRSPDVFRATIGRIEPDCVLLDSISGQLDFDSSWVEAVWAHDRSRPVPIVLFTANRKAIEEALARLSARSESVFGVVTKPFNIDVLLDTVATAIGRSPRFDRSSGADRTRTAALIAALEAAGAHDVWGSQRREWVTFAVQDALAILYWSQRDGVYYVLREPAQSGPPRQIGRFYDVATAVAVAVSEQTTESDNAS